MCLKAFIGNEITTINLIQLIWMSKALIDTLFRRSVGELYVETYQTMDKTSWKLAFQNNSLHCIKKGNLMKPAIDAINTEVMQKIVDRDI